jgi:hypothetical protein
VSFFLLCPYPLYYGAVRAIGHLDPSFFHMWQSALSKERAAANTANWYAGLILRSRTEQGTLSRKYGAYWKQANERSGQVPTLSNRMAVVQMMVKEHMSTHEGLHTRSSVTKVSLRYSLMPKYGSGCISAHLI